MQETDTKTEDSEVKDKALNTVLISLTLFLMFMITAYGATYYILINQKHPKDYDTEKVALIAKELKIENKNIILSDGNSLDFDIVYTPKNDYRVNFTITENDEVRLLNLVKIK
jgi:hypothetical protein